jgi:hypothetical protein
MRLSKSKALIKLVGADAAGVLMFEAGSGSAKKTAEFKYADLTSGDKAAIVSAVVAQEPDNSALCGVAAFYMQVAGQQDMARIYFARAGHSEAAKFRSFFTGRE